MLNINAVDLPKIFAELIGEGEMFTSVDISNSLKRQGVWISNSVVASELRKFSWEQFGYTKSIINVNGNINATLYHPVGTSALDYKPNETEAIDPKAFYALNFEDGEFELSEVQVHYTFVRSLHGQKAKEFMKKIERIR